MTKKDTIVEQVADLLKSRNILQDKVDDLQDQRNVFYERISILQKKLCSTCAHEKSAGPYACMNCVNASSWSSTAVKVQEDLKRLQEAHARLRAARKTKEKMREKYRVEDCTEDILITVFRGVLEGAKKDMPDLVVRARSLAAPLLAMKQEG